MRALVSLVYLVSCFAASDPTLLQQGVSTQNEAAFNHFVSSSGFMSEQNKARCKSWCTQDNCKWKACLDCDVCSAAPPDPSGAKCEGSCAAAGTVTVSDGTSFQPDQCGITTGGPYSPTTCPMQYLGWASKKDVNKFCEGNGAGGPWAEVDLGALTSFNTIEVVQPQRKTYSPPGYCGLEVWGDGKRVYSAPRYTANPAYSGANQVTTVKGTFTGQKVRVKYGRSAKNPTAHLYGINVYDK